MEKSIKIMLAIGFILLVVYAGFLINDYSQFQQNLEQITLNLESSSPDKLEAAWFTVVVFRSAEFLTPALILLFVGITMHIKDVRRPRPKRR